MYSFDLLTFKNMVAFLTAIIMQDLFFCINADIRANEAFAWNNLSTKLAVTCVAEVIRRLSHIFTMVVQCVATGTAESRPKA